jgi:hypothetical protein
MKRAEIGQQRDMDPLAGVANLFDASIVLIVSMMIALFMTYNMLELFDFDAKSEVTITKKNAEGEVEMIAKKGKEIKVQKVTDKEMSGSGTRLGTAYQLEDGRVVYVPE